MCWHCSLLTVFPAADRGYGDRECGDKNMATGNAVQEIFDIQVLAGPQRPYLVGIEDSLADEIVTFP